MKYSLGWLREQTAQGTHFDYEFFWGHTQKQPGIIDKSCFSQWFPASFKADDVMYPTAEHWMMAKKALLFNDRQRYNNIITAASPAIAKKEGRAVANFNEQVWKQHAYNFVVEGNLHKFSQHAEMKSFLWATGNKIIVEASPFDKIWGIGMKEHETNPFKWKGTNLLGFALMEVRDQCKET
jgi:conserved hypothetical protein, ribA/ribD-fused